MIAFAGAVFQTTASYSAFGGMYVEEYKKLDVSVGGVWWFPWGHSAQRDTSDSAVTLSSAPNTGYSSITAFHWMLKLEIEANGQTPANQKFKLEFYKLSSDGSASLVDTLYVQSDGDPASGEKAVLFFDIGSTSELIPGNDVTFQLVITRV